MFDIINNKTYRLLFVIAVITTLLLTLSVPTELARSGLINDKVAHGVAFFFLAFLLSHTLEDNYGFKAIVGLAFFGFIIELIQYYLPWRTFSWYDSLADLTGIICYDLIHRIKIKFFNSKHK